MIAPTTQLLVAAGSITALAWLSASWRPRSARWIIAVAVTLGYTTLLTWRVILVNRAGLGLPSGSASPAVNDVRSIGLTFAWAIAVAQVLTPRQSRCPAAELAPVLTGLALLVWPHTSLYASLARAGAYRGDALAALLVALSLASSAVMLRGALARFASTGCVVGSDWGSGERALTVASSAIAALALAALTRQTVTSHGFGVPSATWLAVLTALHALAALSALFRAGNSRVPLAPAVGAAMGLVAYVMLASAGRLPGA